MVVENDDKKTVQPRGPVFVILLGPPGCGKGTHARELSNTVGLAHISTGDILRKAAKENTELGRMIQTKMTAGELVPDSLVCQTVVYRTSQPDCERGAILDGFPRTLDQAIFLCPKLPLRQTLVLNLQIDRTVLMQRILGRRTCPACGEIYNIHFKPPRMTGYCDRDSVPLERRTDDNEVTVQQRLIEYDQQIQPLASFFKDMNIRQDINADVEPATLTAQLCSLVEAAMKAAGKNSQ
ncbi:MAG TPA: nucleoside monophosphate kinase [Terriglobales bacterium]|nr:nucleoside monophosphate kinase [Terriglobales bacterium]